MDYTPLSPFKRPISFAHLKPIPRGEPVNKWEVLRNLTKVRASYGLRDRDLGVLQALLSFHGGDTLDPSGDLVVFASNRAIAERLNGMPESTLRRHVARLVDSGVIARRDSPNGKRFRLKSEEGPQSFGLDLAPLPGLAKTLQLQAEAARAQELKLIRLRLRINLMRRDLQALCTLGRSVLPGDAWDEAAALHDLSGIALRRKSDLEALTRLAMSLGTAVAQAKQRIEDALPPDLSASDSQIERDHHKSKKEDLDSEKGQEVCVKEEILVKDATQTPPLPLVTKACPEIALFSGGEIQTWPQLFSAVCKLRPAIGITPALWDEAIAILGRNAASVVLAAILQRFSAIRSPGAYLRSLCAKAAAAKFSCIPMVANLLVAGQGTPA